jgi:hypothetical protein
MNSNIEYNNNNNQKERKKERKKESKGNQTWCYRGLP